MGLYTGLVPEVVGSNPTSFTNVNGMCDEKHSTRGRG